ncbi:ORF6N domain-containing protein [Sulfurovum sp.]|jgi:phage regulator Rha-like protein|uniref:ORF6N domain-containing protein n=1 Tax=Sulfurovum sp. TaxID=1969726 RepID=UPI002A3653FF|nr:ORF6N domain-containing protein [Sulfurovum sp.]MDY0402787.1 ORF6N domain-containing protein [Sulfurovum sp.]
MNELITIDKQTIQDKIYTIRGVQVMLDEDLAVLYGVETKVFNQAVKRNIGRFPEKFRFQLVQEEYDNLRFQKGTSSLRSQFVTLESGRGKHRKYLPYAFTEQGVSMLSAVLRSQTAIEVSIKIIDSFVEMRKFISSNADMFLRFERVEQRLSLHDEKFNKIFQAIEDKEIKPKQHIFYDGQIFDAYLFVSDIIKSAKSSIKLIDNYVDESTLVLFTKREADVTMQIYTKHISKKLQLDIKKHNAQYPKIEIEKFDLSHDRFLIIDEKEIYHFGASLKDLGKKWFAVSKMDIDSFALLEKL